MANEFTEEELAIITAVWVSEPPVECKGMCELVVQCGVEWCKGCGWDDY